MKIFSRCARPLLALLFFILAAVPPVAAGTLSGVVRNGTTGTVVPRQDVVLIQLQGGMQPVETVKTDEQGRYHFDRPEIGQSPMLVRAPYGGVNYHQNVPPGTSTADVEVFEASAAAASLAVVNHAIILQPQGADLVVGEEFSIHNLSKPPATYFSEKGTFEFLIPNGAQIGQVSAAGPAGMPLPQSAADRPNNLHVIAFAFKPGENTVRISYRLPYEGNHAALRVVSPLPAQRVVLAGPTGVQLSSEGFSPAGEEKGYTFYAHDAVAANFPLAITVSGSAPPASAGGAGRDARDSMPGSSAANSGSDSGSPNESVPVSAFAPRLAGVQWILVAGFAALFALGVLYLWRHPRASALAGAGNAGPVSTSTGPRSGEGLGGSLASSAQSSPASTAASVADLDRGVRLSLDELKDALFRLELRHQAGTISGDDYASERARFESVLRGLVRG